LPERKNAARPAAEGVGEGDERPLIIRDDHLHTDRTLFFYRRGYRLFGIDIPIEFYLRLGEPNELFFKSRRRQRLIGCCFFGLACSLTSTDEAVVAMIR
jgi:hypothetical protein